MQILKSQQYSRHNISEYDRIIFHTDDAPVASVKKQAPGAIVLFRLGDFYEAFYEMRFFCLKN